MPKLTITFRNMALLVNKKTARTGADVLLPTTAHTADLIVNDDAEASLPGGSDIQIVDSAKAPLPETETVPPGREFVPHAEDALGASGVIAPAALTAEHFRNPNAARVRLRGGSIRGVAARGALAQRFPVLKTMLWDFRIGGVGPLVHTQKLTDTMIYEIDLAAGTYYFEIRPVVGSPSYVPINLSADVSATISNEDTASAPHSPNFTLREYKILWTLTEVAAQQQTIPVGEGHTFNDKDVVSKDSICGNLQIDI